MDEIWIDSQYTKRRHRIRIWLPEGGQSNEKYAVIYMPDGQNVWYDEESFSGHSWRVTDSMMGLKNFERMMIVAIDNNEHRYEEYSPWKCENRKSNFKNREYGGQGDLYADFLAKEVKKQIDETYHTKEGKENAILIGSSMGAFISIYTAFKYQDVFGKVGVFSIASWFAENQFLSYVEKITIDKTMKIFLYVGGMETSDPENFDMPKWYMANTQNLHELLLKKGHPAKHIFYHFKKDGKHTESCWAEVFPLCLAFFQKK